MNIQNIEAVHESMDKVVDEYSEHRSCARVNGQGGGLSQGETVVNSCWHPYESLMATGNVFSQKKLLLSTRKVWFFTQTDPSLC